MMAQEPIHRRGTVRILTGVRREYRGGSGNRARRVRGTLASEHREWQYYISGQARMGVFASSGQARTFDFQAGDVGYVPFAMGHYVENAGTTTLRFLEMFKSSYYADLSLNQWMALTPPELLKVHLNLDQQVTSALKKAKVPVRPA
jgi:oxalate decarboxylase